jgi:hypothetical protein
MLADLSLNLNYSLKSDNFTKIFRVNFPAELEPPGATRSGIILPFCRQNRLNLY